VQVVVPDASVILKWALPSDAEPAADRALQLRNAIRDDVVVPSLWLFEVGNTVARRFPQHARAWLAALAKFDLEEQAVTVQWLRQAVDLTERYAVPFYDASYHATAIVQGGVFVTADERYVAQASLRGGVVSLQEWVPPG
jgi:predicted nucleic acid-binding protein